jgi:hypothetical protein
VTAGDVWAALIELNRERLRRGGPPLAAYTALCREIAGADLGELDMTGARSLLRRYSAAWIESTRKGRPAGPLSAAQTPADAAAL